MPERMRIALLTLITVLSAAAACADELPSHPLDGLTAAEYAAVFEALRSAGRIDDGSRIATISLAEPEKPAVLRWKPGDPLRRRASVAVWREQQLFTGIVDIGTGQVERWTRVEGAQPPLLGSDFLAVQRVMRQSEAWQAALRRRGIDNLKTVFCFPMFPGYFDTELDHDDRRIAMLSCFDGGTPNGLWGRPIAGLTAIVDLDAGVMIRLIDTGPIPLPEGGPPVADVQPRRLPASGPAESRIRRSGQWIEWDRWRFHLRIDPRVGPVLSQVSIRDGKRWRSVLYEGSISEMFVPYMDPTGHWYFRTFLDVGEYGIGQSGTPLIAGEDCPADAEMIDAPFIDDRGRVSTTRGIACLFERRTGDVAWSHFEISNGASRHRRYSELVARFVVWLGNYDYVIDWIFTETGTLKGRVGATGIVQIKAVETRHMADATASDDTAYGRLIRPGMVAVNHDHFFNFRLDLDVDGTENSFAIDRLVPVNLANAANDTPRRQIWRVRSQLAPSESAAKLNVDPARPAVWRVVNTGALNTVGNPVSYQLYPARATRTLMDDGEFAHRRAAFTAYNLWVTPYHADERYAAGDWPNRHPGGAGLPAWTASDRDIENKDIVLWYTLGMHHVVRAEDWPIMPTVQSEFELRPFDFFDYNPTATD